MVKIVIALLSTVLCIFSISAAQEFKVTHRFEPNKTIIAEEFNTNFKDLEHEIKSLRSQIESLKTSPHKELPNGAIIPWHPGEQDIDMSSGKMGIKAPPGWAICDGGNGTPDLRGQFLRGLPSDVSVASFLNDPSKQYGAPTHNHGSHKHNLIGGGKMPVTTGETLKNETTVAPAVEVSHLPPYVIVVYIMRLGEE